MNNQHDAEATHKPIQFPPRHFLNSRQTKSKNSVMLILRLVNIGQMV
jgi:hypothetical protein